MHKKRMEKHNIALLHLQIQPGHVLLIPLNPEIGLIDFALPLRIHMLVKLPLMAPRVDIQRPVLFGRILKRRPRSHNPICWPEWEIG